MRSTRLAVLIVFVVSVAVPLSGATERYFLEVDGANVGEVFNVSGGVVSAEVILETLGPTYFVKKHIGSPKYEDLVFSAPALQYPSALANWINGALTFQYQRKNGSIVTIDNQGNMLTKVEFFQALISQIAFSPADSSSNAPAMVTVHIAPEYTRSLKTSGRSNLPADLPSARQSSFRFVVGNFPPVTSGQLSAASAKQTITEAPVGEERDYLKEPGKLEFPNFKLTLDAADAQPFVDWHRTFVIQGNCGEDQEKTGTLAFLSTNSRQTPLAVKFFNMGIFGVRPAANGKVDIDLYVERFELLQP